MSMQVVRVGLWWVGRAAGEAGDVGPSRRMDGLCAGLVNHLRVTYLQYLAFGGWDGGSA
jgi:hypothetical protein